MPTATRSVAPAREVASRRLARARQHAPRNTPCVDASQLMGVGNGLLLPRLDGVPTQHHLALDLQTLIPLARNLVRLNIAPVELWAKANAEPMAYAEMSLLHWINAHGGEMIGRRFTYVATLTSILDDTEDEDRESGGTLYITLEPASAGYVVLGPTLELLEKVDGNLPATFFELFAGALCKWVRVYDYRDAEERAEMYKEMAAVENNPEEYEFANVAGCIPSSIKQEGLDKRHLLRLVNKSPSTLASRLLRQVVNIDRISDRVERPALSEDDRTKLGDTNPAVPGLLAVFSENDAIEACFDDEAQYALECPPEPNLIIPMDPLSPGSVRRAFDVLGVVCRVLAGAVCLMDAMPCNSEWTIAR
jgi:hypothetical protein